MHMAVSVLKIGISQNIKYENLVNFSKSGHKCCVLQSRNFSQVLLQLTNETDHLEHDVTTYLIEQLVESTAEVEQLKKTNNNLQQCQSSL